MAKQERGPSESSENVERDLLEARVRGIYNNLVEAFGGKSQLPDFVTGEALAGQVNNNQINILGETGGTREVDPKDLCDMMAKAIDEGWGDQEEYYSDKDKIRKGFADFMADVKKEKK